MSIPFCRAMHNGTFCEELEGHTPLELGGRKFDHAAHTRGVAWNVDDGENWEAELLAELPAHTYVEVRSSRMLPFTDGARPREQVWTATWTHPAGGWSVYKYAARTVIRGWGVKLEYSKPSAQAVIDALRAHGALDDPAITGVSWEARRWLATEFEAYALECAKRLGRDITTHDESHINGMSAGVAWLRGEISAPPERKPVPETEAPQWRTMAELIRDAWTLIRTAHGGQPWTAAGEWQTRATEWRDAYRLNNPSAELVEGAWDLIRSVEDGNWNDAPLTWQTPAADWRDRYIAWRDARS